MAALLVAHGAQASAPPSPGVLLKSASEAVSAAAPVSASAMIDATAARLRKEHDAWLDRPEVYGKKALAECAVFPEGQIYPFALPALAYANLARRNPGDREPALTQMRKLIDLLIPLIATEVKPPGGDLRRLASYQQHGTCLATLHFVLAHYGRLTDDRRFRALQSHVSGLLHRALSEANGRALASYPAYTWYFDTVMALASLCIEDEPGRTPSAGMLLRKHLEWRRQYATHASTGLPRAYEGGLPRGCDLSMQVCLLAPVAPEAARDLYDRYAGRHWVDYGIIAGFSEWPSGCRAPWNEDVDSGPVVLGIGMTATGVGIGAALVMNDTARLAKLAKELQAVPQLLSLVQLAQGQAGTLFGGLVPLQAAYVTGFLYGDAVLFYAVTCAPSSGSAADSMGPTSAARKAG